jgi:hypothetical protein
MSLAGCVGWTFFTALVLVFYEDSSNYLKDHYDAKIGKDTTINSAPTLA